jgi:hypothetical protein
MRILSNIRTYVSGRLLKIQQGSKYSKLKEIKAVVPTRQGVRAGPVPVVHI